MVGRQKPTRRLVAARDAPEVEAVAVELHEVLVPVDPAQDPADAAQQGCGDSFMGKRVLRWQFLMARAG